MASIDRSSIIALSSVGGFFVLLLLVAIVSYCYRRRGNEVHQKKVEAKRVYQNGHLKGPAQNSYSKNPRSVPVYAREIRSPRMNQVYNTTSRVPGGGFVPVSQVSQPNMSSKGYFVHSMGGNHMVHQVPIRSLISQSYVQGYQSRPVMSGPVPITYEKKQHSTAPPLRLGAYRPKVITDYFSPHNVREAFDDSRTKSYAKKEMNHSPSAVYDKDGYKGYTDRGKSWYSKQTEVMIGTIDLGDEDDHSKTSVSSQRETPKHIVTSEPKFQHSNNIQVTESEKDKSYKVQDYSFVIVDYLSETLKSNKSSRVTGPLITSTPRYVEQTLRIPRQDSDSGVESLETNKRQRHAHEGSIEDLPSQ